MIRISTEQAADLHSQLISETGGTDGIRDEGLLGSAIGAPFQSFGDRDLFPTVQQKAARLGFGLIKNHAFVDGNKRIGVHCMLVFLTLNGIELDYTQEELADMVLAVASGNMDLDELLDWILEHQI